MKSDCVERITVDLVLLVDIVRTESCPRHDKVKYKSCGCEHKCDKHDESECYPPILRMSLIIG
jgi:hypothetical protein